MKTTTLLLTVAVCLGASDLRHRTIIVRVGPEALVSVHGMESLEVRIRLSPGARAQLWVGDNCGVLPVAGYPINQSGMYQINLSMVPGTGRTLCLASPQDGLMESAPLTVARAAEVVRCTSSDCYVL